MNRLGLIVGGLLLLLMLLVVDALHRRPAPGRGGLRVRPDQGSHPGAGPEVEAAAAVPERRLPRPPHPDARQPRNAADLHRREEEPGDRLARQVARHRPAPVHPQQRRRHAQPRGAAVADRPRGDQRGGHQAHRRRRALDRARQGDAGRAQPPRRRRASRSASRSSTCASSASTSSATSPSRSTAGWRRSASRSPTSCARPAPPRARRSAPMPTGSAR